MSRPFMMLAALVVSAVLVLPTVSQASPAMETAAVARA